MDPADRMWLTKQLAALFACYPPSDMPQVAWQAAAGAYLESLAHWPPDIAVQAFRRARETCRFRPTIAELVAIGEPLVAQRRRIREPVSNGPALPAPERIPVERVDAIMARWRPAPDRPKQTHVAPSRHEERKAEGQRMFEAWCAERGVDPDAMPKLKQSAA